MLIPGAAGGAVLNIARRTARPPGEGVMRGRRDVAHQVPAFATTVSPDLHRSEGSTATTAVDFEHGILSRFKQAGTEQTTWSKAVGNDDVGRSAWAGFSGQ